MDHLSRLENGAQVKGSNTIIESFPNEHLFTLKHQNVPWYVDYVNFLVSKVLLTNLNSQQKKTFLHDVKFYVSDEPFLFKQCADQILRRCFPAEEIKEILYHCHSSEYGGHFGGE